VLVPPLLELVAADVLDPPELPELLELDLLDEPQPAATRATTATRRTTQYRPLLFALTVDMLSPPLPRARPRCRQLIG
jgi:hypothetical protein